MVILFKVEPAMVMEVLVVEHVRHGVHGVHVMDVAPMEHKQDQEAVVHQLAVLM